MSKTHVIAANTLVLCIVALGLLPLLVSPPGGAASALLWCVVLYASSAYYIYSGIISAPSAGNRGVGC